jgi:hypothetical protein
MFKPHSTFYGIMCRNTEIIATFQDMVIANHRERLWIILVNHVFDNRASHRNPVLFVIRGVGSC